jgi:DNA-binding transcriptional LysR family regulator
VQRRYEGKNIPIEVLRAFVTVVDSGSFTKAGDLLGLSQAAISAQIARLRRILHGQLFERGAGSQLTSRGATALSYARRIITLNDQLIATAGPKPAPRQFVMGLPRWYDYAKLVELIQVCSRVSIPEKLSFRCGGDSAEVARELSAGSIDLAYLANVQEPPSKPIVEWLEPIYWAKSPALILAPGEPIPLVGWPGTLAERLATKLLSEADIPYSIVFMGADHASRKAAVAAGLGVLLMMERALTPEVEVIHDPDLPKCPLIKTGLYVREGLNIRRIAPLVRTLNEVLKPRMVPTLVSSQSKLAHNKGSRRSRD